MSLQTIFMDNRSALAHFLRARGAGDLVEDILQDMWVKVGDVDPESVVTPLPYLFRMADNVLRDRFRVGSNRKVREQAWGELAPVHTESADTHLVTRESLKEADAALRALGDRTYSILLRYRLDGISQKEIARELGVSLSLVEKHLQRAYQVLGALRRQWAAEGDAPRSTRQGKIDARR